MVPGTEEYRAYQREWQRKQAPEKQAAALATARAWKARNPERVKEMRRAYRQKNLERERENSVRWAEENKERLKELKARCGAAYRAANAERIKAYRTCDEHKARRNSLARERYHTDPGYRTDKILRAAFRQALRLHGDGRKTKSVTSLIGCSMADFITHLESQMAPGMTLFNTHIDHIRPCASFDLTDPEQQRECFHFSNLRPMWPIDNIRKGAKW